MRRTQRVWFVSCPGTELLDTTGPWAVLGYANEVTGRASYAPELLAPLGGTVPTRHGLALAGARPLSLASPGRLPDLLVVAGGSPDTPVPAAEAAVATWLRKHHQRIPRVISICTGAFVLGEARLLDGRRATTHWAYLEELKRRFPRARVVDDDIFLRQGRVWTSAGITAGIDLMLAVVEEDHGHAVAMAVAKALVLFLRRPGRQAQFSPVLRHQEHEAGRLRDLSAYVLEHVDRPLSVDRVARAMALSTRTFTRWCHAELGQSPAAYVRRMRLDEARRLLEHSSEPLKTVARRTGLGDASTLWRLFRRELGVTPAEYRVRFSALTGSGASR